jgi:hypothetical protein
VAEDCTLRLWDMATYTALGQIEMPRTLPWAVAYSPDGHALLTTHADGRLRTWLTDPDDNSLLAKSLAATALVPRASAEFTTRERRQYALDSQVGGYALSASGNANRRPEPYVISMIAQPRATGVSTETLIALTNEKFLLTSVDQGESWRIVTQLPLTLTYNSLGIPARPTDPLLIASEQGLYRVGDDGALTLLHSDPISGVGYSHTNSNELWAARGSQVFKSEDGGATWGEASANLSTSDLFAPLLVTPPNNNPQVVIGVPNDGPIAVLWRGAGNGFWERLAAMPFMPDQAAGEIGIAWDASNRTLYLSGTKGDLLASTNIDAPNIADVTASMVEQFGLGTRPVPLAVGQGPNLYVNLLTVAHPRLLRGTWDGNAWSWVELRLPLVAAG